MEDDMMGPDMPPCPACGTNDWKQDDMQMQRDEWKCGKCGEVYSGRKLQNMKDKQMGKNTPPPADMDELDY